MSSKKRILVVDDERHIVEFLVMNLRQNQYESLIAYDGYEAVRISRAESPDLILLDSMLPGMSGIETCRTLKQDEKTRHIPIIFLTAKSEESDKVIGLGLGADDYITKPFGLRELFARIEAVLRRSSQDGLSAAQAVELKLQDLAINVESFSVEKAGRKISLSPTEFSLLVILSRNVGKVVARKKLMESLALGTETAEGRSLDVHVRNLRKKLGKSPNSGGYIDSIRGIGLKASS
jgi:two-component system alkaline phosphatase synthesis response regulator PhoP